MKHFVKLKQFYHKLNFSAELQKHPESLGMCVVVALMNYGISNELDLAFT